MASKENRDDVFSYLKPDNGSLLCKGKYIIPESLVKYYKKQLTDRASKQSSKKKKKKKNDNEELNLMMFEYDIPNKCFYFSGYQPPLSLFFEIFSQTVCIFFKVPGF